MLILLMLNSINIGDKVVSDLQRLNVTISPFIMFRKINYNISSILLCYHVKKHLKTLKKEQLFIKMNFTWT